MKFDNFTIVSDLDGTLLDSNKVIPKANVEAIEYFKSNGGRFTIATGRDIRFLERRLTDVAQHVNAPAILSGGAHIFDFESETTLRSTFLPRENAWEIVNIIYSAFPDVSIEIPSTEEFLVINYKDFFDRRFRGMEDMVSYFDKPVIPSENFNRLSIMEYNEKTIKDVSELVMSSPYTDGLDFVFSESFIFEIFPKGSTKGNGVNYLKSIFPDDKIICVGDYYNDITQLQAAHLPVCPSNAVKAVKDYCKYILCHCNDGVISDIVYGIEKNTFKFGG